MIEEQSVEGWLPDEIERRAAVERGETVVAKKWRDKNLTHWASQNKLLKRIGRTTKWGNPFEIGKDGTREEVCERFAREYLPNQPALLGAVAELKGKVIECACYPERCHGDTLKELADNAEQGA
jgi:hypothetical protein